MTKKNEKFFKQLSMGFSSWNINLNHFNVSKFNKKERKKNLKKKFSDKQIAKAKKKN